MGFFPAESRLTLVKGAKLNVSFLEICKSAFSLLLPDAGMLNVHRRELQLQTHCCRSGRAFYPLSYSRILLKNCKGAILADEQIGLAFKPMVSPSCTKWLVPIVKDPDLPLTAFELFGEILFDVPVQFRDFADHCLDASTLQQVRARFVRPMRVNLLRKR